MSKFNLIAILLTLLLAYAIYDSWPSLIVIVVAGCYLYELYSRWFALLSQPYPRHKVIYLLLPRFLLLSSVFLLLYGLLPSASIAALVAYLILRVAEFALDRYGLFYLAEAQLKSGQFAAAIDSYQQYLQKFGNQADLLYDLGCACLADGAYDAATGHFRELLQAEPGRPSYLYHLALAQLNLKQVEDAEQLLQQIISDAKEREWVLHACSLLAALWEQMQKHDPTSYWLTHQLAILYHRSAIELEEEGQTEAADCHWRKAIANWVLLIETDAFWQRWPRERETVYGKPIQQTDIENLRRHDLHERLIQLHRDAERAYIRQEQKERAAQHKEYRLLFTLEAKTAAALRKTVARLRQQGQSVELSVMAGPLMLSHLGLLEEAKEVATLAQKVEAEAEAQIVQALVESLSPFARFRLLIEEGEPELAIQKLKPLLSQDQNNPLLRRLLVDALIEAGQDLASSKPNEAISRWVEALDYEPENKEVRERLAKLSITLASKLQRRHPEQAISILKFALHHAPDDQALKQNLSALTPSPSPNNGRGG